MLIFLIKLVTNHILKLKGFLGGSVVKNSLANAGDTGLIPGWGRCPGGGNSNPLQYSCQENSMERVAWRVIVHEVTKSWTWLRKETMTNLESILKSRDITLPTKICQVKAMVLPAVMYGCTSWTVKKAECRRIDTFELWCWRRLLRVPWQGDPTSPS